MGICFVFSPGYCIPSDFVLTPTQIFCCATTVPWPLVLVPRGLGFRLKLGFGVFGSCPNGTTTASLPKSWYPRKANHLAQFVMPGTRSTVETYTLKHQSTLNTPNSYQFYRLRLYNRVPPISKLNWQTGSSTLQPD